MIDVIESAWRRVVACAFLVGMLAAPLSACSQDDTVAVGYEAYNHTATPIDSVIINGEGGVLNATAYGGGGGVCCVILPSKWHRGLKATIKWEEDGDWLKDRNGNVVIRDGKKVYVPVPYKEKTVNVPEYVGGDQTGRFRVHFFPNDEVKVTVLPYGPGHKDYPYPYPKDPKVGKDAPNDATATIAISTPDGLTEFMFEKFAGVLPVKDRATTRQMMVEVFEFGARHRVTAFQELTSLAVATAYTNGKVLHHPRLAAWLDARAWPKGRFEDGLVEFMETAE